MDVKNSDRADCVATRAAPPIISVVGSKTRDFPPYIDNQCLVRLTGWWSAQSLPV